MHRTLSDYIVDLSQNSVEAGSGEVAVDLSERDGRIRVCISDNGKGMDAETLALARDPFFTGGGKHEKRKVGLGISFLAQFMAHCGGEWDIKSEKDAGTTLWFEYDAKNVDAPPMGNLASAVTCCLTLPGGGPQGGFEFKFTRTLGDESYSVSRSEAAEVFGDINSADALLALREFIQLSERELFPRENEQCQN